MDKDFDIDYYTENIFTVIKNEYRKKMVFNTLGKNNLPAEVMSESLRQTLLESVDMACNKFNEFVDEIHEKIKHIGED